MPRKWYKTKVLNWVQREELLPIVSVCMFNMHCKYIAFEKQGFEKRQTNFALLSIPMFLLDTKTDQRKTSSNKIFEGKSPARKPTLTLAKTAWETVIVVGPHWGRANIADSLIWNNSCVLHKLLFLLCGGAIKSKVHISFPDKFGYCSTETSMLLQLVKLDVGNIEKLIFYVIETMNYKNKC